MNYLLDTHVYLWWQSEQDQLSETARSAIKDVSNTIFISAAVPWEITIKRNLGKLKAPENIMDFMEVDNFLPLSISYEHISILAKLTDHHHDPFDRIQIAQAIAEDLTLITRDKQILKYEEVKTLEA
ncbi:MAG: PIN domain nuclease of toxin-antitoxin system [Cyclobacteriaceae bacterium]|jgi:PIN domain nuclease of toxin-antitoxin system